MMLLAEILLGVEKLDNESSGALNFFVPLCAMPRHCSTNSVFCLALLTLATSFCECVGRKKARSRKQRQGCHANDIPTICQAGWRGRGGSEAVCHCYNQGGPSSGWLWMPCAAFLSFFLEERVPDRVDGCIMYCLFSAFICGIDQSASPPRPLSIHAHGGLSLLLTMSISPGRSV